MTPRKCGKPFRWQTTCCKKRQDLKVDLDLRPWTSRPSVQLHGISRQLSSPNFVCELLDVHFLVDAQRNHLSSDGPPRSELMADITQDLRYQTQGGPTSMLSASRIYVYERDRTTCPEENLRLNGWGDDVNMAAVDRDVIGEFRQHASGQPLKKSRGKKVLASTKLRDLAGNGECLPDLGAVVVPLVLVMNAGFFEHKLVMSEIPFEAICAGTVATAETNTKKISLPLDVSPKAVLAMEKGAQAVAGADGDSDLSDDID